MNHGLIYVIFLIFAGTALLSTLALFSRQSLLAAYILIGAILGPWGFKLVTDSALIRETGSIGIIFLLFLLGLDLQPQRLWHSLRKMSWITTISSLIFLTLGFFVATCFGFDFTSSLIIGIAMMFSSTIIGIKLLPTTILHHQHTGEIMISILLLQDLIAIAALLVIQGIANQIYLVSHLWHIVVGFPLLLLTGFFLERYVITKLLLRFDKIHEYIFILSIGWCLCMAEFAHFMGLPEEIGAFIAGISLATTPISQYIAESLKPLRDFFLVIFFFTIGAGFNFDFLPQVILPALTLTGLMLLVKPYIFSWLLRYAGENQNTSWEVGVRLGQVSEFSLLVVYLALDNHIANLVTTYTVQTITVLSFIISSYWIVMRFPTPLASTDQLRRD
jgi:Kef-type K+ transport system membrane component KefB